MDNADAGVRYLTRLFQTATEPLLVALDGRCAAGKTTLAGRLATETGCSVIPMDAFFLRAEQRTPRRERQPGGNVDYERFLEEVMRPLRLRQPFSYRPYDCHRQCLAAPVAVTPGRVTVIEGSYSCHPALWDFCDLHIFLTVSPEEQLRRIRQRNGEERLAVFRDRWIPLEERYFAAFDIEQRCDLRLESSDALTET